MRLLLAALLTAAPAVAEEGIPVTSPLVRAACGSCHPSDDDGRMTRISHQRKSAEGWQITIVRMMRTGNVDLEPEDARAIVRYLTDSHGLAPEEERPVFHQAEQRAFQETVGEDEELLQETCSRCHLTARFRAQRRTAEEWDLLKGMHVGYFPVIEFQTFRGSPAADGSWAVDRALDQLKEKYPFSTPEFEAHRAKGPGAGIAGRWTVRGHLPGAGPIGGFVEFEPGPDGDWRERTTFVHRDGTVEERTGSGVLYGGFSFRGRTDGPVLGERRAALLLSDDGATLTGRMFRGRFGEDGVELTLTRGAGASAAWPRSARRGETVSLRILGDGFAHADGLDFGAGVTVTRTRVVSGQEIAAEVAIDPDAGIGYRDLALGGTRLVDGFAVHDGIGYVKVTPEQALARVGGAVAPRQPAQFEAVGWHSGRDGEPLTGDDLDLGLLDVSWSTAEYYIRDEDADTRFVGNVNQRGLFTPALDGPNPERPLNADNMGDVWIVAEYAAPDGRTLRGRARLVVAPPVFIHWDLFPERAGQ